MALYRCVGGASGTAITPSNSSPVTLTDGETYTVNSNGVAIGSYSLVSPSNNSPASLGNGSIYKTNGSGYAISSYSSVTPSTGGTYFSSGMVKMPSSGYAYSSRPSVNPSGYTELTRQTTAAVSHTFSVTDGDVLLVLLTAWGSAALAVARYDNATCSGGTITKLCNLTNANANVAGTFYIAKATSSSITFSHTYSNYVRVFKVT